MTLTHHETPSFSSLSILPPCFVLLFFLSSTCPVSSNSSAQQVEICQDFGSSLLGNQLVGAEMLLCACQTVLSPSNENKLHFCDRLLVPKMPEDALQNWFLAKLFPFICSHANVILELGAFFMLRRVTGQWKLN